MQQKQKQQQQHENICHHLASVGVLFRAIEYSGKS